ncbi:MAG: thioredoxin family protein [Bacteroidales bacterium]|nr:thioredoxin family protein [Bacteroidales bacterium]
MKKIISLAVLAVIVLSSGFGQNPFSFDYSSTKLSNDTYELSFSFDIKEDWHLYGKIIEGEGPVPMRFSFDKNERAEFLTEIVPQQKPEIKYEEVFPATVELYGGKVTFKTKVRIKGEQATKLTGFVEVQACSGGSCIPPLPYDFEFSLSGSESIRGFAQSDKKVSIQSIGSGEKPTSPVPAFKTETISITATEGITEDLTNDSLKEDLTETATEIESTTDAVAADEKGNDKTMPGLFLLGLLGGLLALLTPCVFPIIPLTVSFFMRDTSRGKAIRNGLIFGISIVMIYTLVGLVAGITRLDPTKAIASHWIPNLIFFLLFLALAFSFLGLYEITLPNSWSNKIDQRADKGGFLGPFFMALATVIISFSCTGIIAGTVLGYAMKGEIIQPVVGMFGFGLTFALPFTLLAIFPGFLSKLPKSGGWLNSVKVFFAFILLASSIMFISNLQLGFFTRELAVSLLVVLLVLLGIYLLGKIRFSHDSELPHVTIPRLLISVVVFGLALRLVPGIFGYPLGVIDSYLPDTYMYEYQPANTGTSSSFNICTDKPKYSDKVTMPHKLKAYLDYDEALSCARELNKPVLLDFTGHTCKNCKYMHKNIWTKPAVSKKLGSEFVIATLFVDDKTKLPEEDQVVSSRDGKLKKTIGAKFHDLQITKFGIPSQPYYVIVNLDGKVLTKENLGYSTEKEFLKFLDEGLTNFKAGN